MRGFEFEADGFERFLGEEFVVGEFEPGFQRGCFGAAA